LYCKSTNIKIKVVELRNAISLKCAIFRIFLRETFLLVEKSFVVTAAFVIKEKRWTTPGIHRKTQINFLCTKMWVYKVWKANKFERTFNKFTYVAIALHEQAFHMFLIC